VIRTPDHVLFSTLEGGARRLWVTTDCGHRFDGPDTPNRLSLAPAERERRLALRHVRASWASLSLSAALVDDLAGRRVELDPFTNIQDDFAVSVLARMAADQREPDGIDPAFGEAVSVAMALHLLRRAPGRTPPPAPMRLNRPRLNRVVDHVETGFGGAIRVADLAAIAGLSTGQFHRAFKATTGLTPLDFITRVRIRRAIESLSAQGLSVTETAASVGYESPSRFARAFRRVTGMSPSALKR
jgi:AraC family transcriptional regulator